jgi:hypothetical protein
MTDTENKSTCTVRVTVKLRPGEYDELYRHVCEIGSTMSAFFRESAVKAMKGGVPTRRALPEVTSGGQGMSARSVRSPQ